MQNQRNDAPAPKLCRCGRLAIIVKTRATGWLVGCPSCGILTTKKHRTKKAAVEYWNEMTGK